MHIDTQPHAHIYKQTLRTPEITELNILSAKMMQMDGGRPKRLSNENSKILFYFQTLLIIDCNWSK